MSILKGIFLLLVFLFGLLIQPILWLIALFVPKDKSIYYHNEREFVHHNCSCDEHWVDSFKSQSELEELEKELLNQFIPIGPIEKYTTKPKVKFLIYESGAKSPETGFIYECKKCQSLYELSDPDNAYRGYFKGINLDKERIKKYLIKGLN